VFAVNKLRSPTLPSWELDSRLHIKTLSEKVPLLSEPKIATSFDKSLAKIYKHFIATEYSSEILKIVRKTMAAETIEYGIQRK